MAGERKVKVRVEVLRGASRWPVLTVDDTRVAGPKCGPYKVVETFMVDRDDLVSALRLEPAPAPPQAEPAPEAKGEETCPVHAYPAQCGPQCAGRAGRGA